MQLSTARRRYLCLMSLLCNCSFEKQHKFTAFTIKLIPLLLFSNLKESIQVKSMGCPAVPHNKSPRPCQKMTRSSVSQHCTCLLSAFSRSKSLLQIHFLAQLSVAQHVVVVVGLQTARGEHGRSCGPPTTSWASSDLDCWSMKPKQPQFINPAHRAAAQLGLQKPGGQKLCTSYMLCSMIVDIHLHYSQPPHWHHLNKLWIISINFLKSRVGIDRLLAWLNTSTDFQHFDSSALFFFWWPIREQFNYLFLYLNFLSTL